jgi:hypothetical protein
VAFNLGQQKELFRDENFNFKSLDRLAETLRKTEMATVPAQALESNAQSEMLARLSQEELTREVPSDAVIFLGPSCRFDKKVPKEVLKTLEGDGRRFFYLEYFPGFMRGGEFPDAIHLLTRDLHGTVFPIHSAPELASSVQRMLLQIKPLDRNLGMASKAGAESEGWKGKSESLQGLRLQEVLRNQSKSVLKETFHSPQDLGRVFGFVNFFT